MDRPQSTLALRLVRVHAAGAALLIALAPPAAAQCLSFPHTGTLSGVGEPQGSEVGRAVATDAETAVVASRGSAYVYVRSANSWTLQAHLTGSGDFGASVALSGSTLVVGAPETTVSGQSVAGAVHVFVRSGSIWSFQQLLVALDPSASSFLGKSVAILGDTVVAGAPGYSGGTSRGAAYVFGRVGSAWTQAVRLLASDGIATDQFGWSVAITSTGLIGGSTVALIGANLDDHAGGAFAGSVYVFRREAIIDGSIWVERARLSASDAIGNEWFGTSVSASGSTVAIGAPQAGVNGSVYVFTGSTSGLTWTQRARLTPTTSAVAARLGMSVAIIGGTIIGGAPFEDVSQQHDAGAAYEFTGSGAAWTQRAKLTASDLQAEREFGTAVAVSSSKALVGGPGNSHLTSLSEADPFDILRLDITSQPAPVTVCLTGPATFTTAATGTSTISFQWRHNGTPIPGATAATLSIPSTIMADSGSYDCVVTNPCGSVTSAAATLTVLGSDPDCNGLVTPADVAVFVGLWFSSLGGTSTPGDYDANGVVNPVDVALFVTDWFAHL